MTTGDGLRRDGLREQLTSAIVGDPNSHSSRTVALVGAWGSGKSWLLDEVRPSLGGITREFNPWLFADEIGIFQGFASLILERIKGRRKRRKVAALLELVGPSMKGGGFDLSGTLGKTAKLVEGLASPSQIRTRIQAATSNDVGPTYVLIDDLDRLTPGELLNVFKLLRLLGDLPGLVYVLAYDEDALLRLLMQTEIAFNSLSGARAYLEKFIETRVDIPPMSDPVRERLVLEPIVLFGSEFEGSFDDERAGTLARTLETLIYPNLTTIRLCERFVAGVCALPPRLSGEIHFEDWVLISFLRVAEPHALKVIQRFPSTFLGTRSVWEDRAGGALAASTKVMQQLTEESSLRFDADEVLAIVDELFPAFASERRGRTAHDGAAAQRVSEPEYFGRYFEYDLSGAEVSDVALDRTLRALAADSSAGDDLQAMVEAMPHETIMAIGRRWKKSIPALPLFAFFERIWVSSVLDYKTGVFQLSGRADVRFIFEGILRTSTRAELQEIEDSLDDSTPPDSLLISLLVRSQSPYGSQYYVEWVGRMRERLTDVSVLRILQHGNADWDATEAKPFFKLLRSLDKKASREVLAKLCSDRLVPAPILLSWVLRSYSDSQNKITSIGIDKDVLADSDLVRLLTGKRDWPYPAEWDENENFLNAVNGDPKPGAEQISRYILGDWESRSVARITDDDD
ncbi:MAG: KAP family P-loop NTPase fold protein [Salinibacterium amurskyense]